MTYYTLSSVGLPALLTVFVLLVEACASPSEGDFLPWTALTELTSEGAQPYSLKLTRAPQGFYTATLGVVGQQARFLVDTGSGDVWIPQGPASLASTAAKSIPGRPFHIAYGSGSASGTVQEGVLGFPGGPEGNCEYGLATREEGQLADLTGEVDGIWGLAPGGGIEGLVQCLAREGKISRQIVSLHLTDMGGTATIGELPAGLELQKIPVVGNGKTWTVPLLAVFVERAQGSTKKPKKNMLGGPEPALLDSGSSGLRAPDTAIEHLAWALAAERNSDGQFVMACESRLQPPDITLRLGTEDHPVDVKLNVDHLLGPDDGKGWCSLALLPSSSGMWILGGTFFRRCQAVAFDYEKNMVSVAVGGDDATAPAHLRSKTHHVAQQPTPEPNHLQAAASAAVHLAAATGTALGADKKLRYKQEPWKRVGEDITGDAGEMGMDIRPDTQKLLDGRFGAGNEEESKAEAQQIDDTHPEPQMQAPQVVNSTEWKDVGKDLSNPTENAEMSTELSKAVTNEENMQNSQQENAALGNAAEAAEQAAKQAGVTVGDLGNGHFDIGKLMDKARADAKAEGPKHWDEIMKKEKNVVQAKQPESPAAANVQPQVDPNVPVEIGAIVDYFGNHDNGTVPEKLSDQIEENKEAERMSNAVKSEMPAAKIDDGIPPVQVTDSVVDSLPNSSDATATTTATETAMPVLANTTVADDHSADSVQSPRMDNGVPLPAPVRGDGMAHTHVEPVAEEHIEPVEGDVTPTEVVDESTPEPVIKDSTPPSVIGDVASKPAESAPMPVAEEPAPKQEEEAPTANEVVDELDHTEQTVEEPATKEGDAAALAPGPPPKSPPKKLGGPQVVPPLSAQAGIVGGLVPNGGGMMGGGMAMGGLDSYSSNANPNLPPTSPAQFDPEPATPSQSMSPETQESAPQPAEASSRQQEVTPASSTAAQDEQPSDSSPSQDSPFVANPAQPSPPAIAAPSQDTVPKSSVAVPVDDAEEDRLKRETNRWERVVERAVERTNPAASSSGSAPADVVAQSAQSTTESAEVVMPSSVSASADAVTQSVPTTPESDKAVMPAPSVEDLAGGHFDIGKLMDKAREVAKAEGPDHWDQVVQKAHAAKSNKAPTGNDLQPVKPLKVTLKRQHHAAAKKQVDTSASVDDDDDDGYGNLMDRAQSAISKLDKSSSGLESTEPIATKSALKTVVTDTGSPANVADLNPNPVETNRPLQEEQASVAFSPSNDDTMSPQTVTPSPDEDAFKPHALRARPLPARKHLPRGQQKKVRIHSNHLPSSQQQNAQLNEFDTVAQDAAHWSQRFQDATTAVESSDGREVFEVATTTTAASVNVQEPVSSIPVSRAGDDVVSSAPRFEASQDAVTSPDGQEVFEVATTTVAPVTVQAPISSPPAGDDVVGSGPQFRIEASKDATLPEASVAEEVQPSMAEQKEPDLQNSESVQVKGADDMDRLAAQAQHWAHRWHVKAEKHRRSSTTKDFSAQTPESSGQAGVIATQPLQSKIETERHVTPNVDKDVISWRKKSASVTAAQARSAWLDPDLGNAVSDMRSAAKKLSASLDVHPKPQVQSSGVPAIDHLMEQADAWAKLYHKKETTAPSTGLPSPASSPSPSEEVEVDPLEAADPTIQKPNHVTASKSVDLSLSTNSIRLRGAEQAAPADPQSSIFSHAEKEEQVWLARYAKH